MISPPVRQTAPMAQSTMAKPQMNGRLAAALQARGGMPAGGSAPGIPGMQPPMPGPSSPGAKPAGGGVGAQGPVPAGGPMPLGLSGASPYSTDAFPPPGAGRPPPGAPSSPGAKPQGGNPLTTTARPQRAF